MKHQYGTKSTFVRLNPSLTAREVVKLAKKRGIKLSLSYVYGVRSAARKQRVVRIVEGVRLGGLKTLADRVASQLTPDAQLRQLIGELGLIRSRGIVAEMERRVA